MRLYPPWKIKLILSRCLMAGLALLLLSLASQAAPVRADDAATANRDIEALARAAQKEGRWLEACRYYEELLHGKDKPSAEARESYQECMRRYNLMRRHNDRTYRDALAKLQPDEAVNLLLKVLDTLSTKYVDPQKTEINALFQTGVQELLFALDEPAFTKEYLTSSDKRQLDPLRVKLLQLKEHTVTRLEVRRELLDLGRAVQSLGLAANPKRILVLLALEFACGACNSLDEYSYYLSPFHFDAARGKLVGVGVDLAIIDGKLEITRVYPKSPADDLGLKPGDRVLEIDQKPVEGLAPDMVAERLLGEADTFIELVVQIQGQPESEKVKVKMVRRPVETTSVEHGILREMGSTMDAIGYIRIYNFQESTTQEVKEAIAQLHADGMKGLILDLRGNPGGLFKSAVQVSELFLGEGVIVFTQGQLKEYNKTHKASGGIPFELPMVVLIDGDTASSAEILAGALKDHKRADLLGQPTFGKGTIQQIVPLDKTGGMRITVARFTSPLEKVIDGVGITPHVMLVETQGDWAAIAAKQIRAMLGKPPMGMIPMMMMRQGPEE